MIGLQQDPVDAYVEFLETQSQNFKKNYLDIVKCHKELR